MTVKERLIKFYQSKGLTKREFERLCGLSNGYIDKLRHSPSTVKMESICLTFPDLNKVWLLTGEGTMLLGESKPQEAAAPDIPSNAVPTADAIDIEFAGANHLRTTRALRSTRRVRKPRRQTRPHGRMGTGDLRRRPKGQRTVHLFRHTRRLHGQRHAALTPGRRQGPRQRTRARQLAHAPHRRPPLLGPRLRIISPHQGDLRLRPRHRHHHMPLPQPLTRVPRLRGPTRHRSATLLRHQDQTLRNRRRIDTPRPTEGPTARRTPHTLLDILD